MRYLAFDDMHANLSSAVPNLQVAGLIWLTHDSLAVPNSG